MSRTRIKFCGIRRPVDAKAAVDLGVDAIGFVLVPQSRRHIAPERAARLRAQLPPFVSAVALFMDASAEDVRHAIDVLRPDLLQFHGREEPSFCAAFGLPYMKAVAMGGTVAPAREARRFAGAAALLLDSHAPGAMGGRGETFDWSKVRALRGPVVAVVKHCVKYSSAAPSSEGATAARPPKAAAQAETSRRADGRIIGTRDSNSGRRRTPVRDQAGQPAHSRPAGSAQFVIGLNCAFLLIFFSINSLDHFILG